MREASICLTLKAYNKIFTLAFLNLFNHSNLFLPWKTKSKLLPQTSKYKHSIHLSFWLLNHQTTPKSELGVYPISKVHFQILENRRMTLYLHVLLALNS